MSGVISDVGRAHLRWALLDGVGPIMLGRISAMFNGDLARAWGASSGDLRQIKGIGAEKADRLARGREEVDVDAEIEAAAREGVRILCREDNDYPAGLQRLPDAPIVLYVKGELRRTDAVAVAIVGSRKCSVYGGEQARRFGELLAGAGFTVISGLARGIDALAHHGAVDAGGRSLAVLGNGLAEVYPPENKPLAARVVEHGALISELPMRAAVRAENFPSRNRIIVGLSLGVLVVEAAKRSGALITARLASEYNREVFAVPGRLQEPMAMGTNALIRDGGAKLVTDLEDVVNELGVLKEAAVGAEKPGLDGMGAGLDGNALGAGSLSPAEARVWGALTEEPAMQDALLGMVDLPAGEVLAALTSLELRALVQRLPGNRVARRRAARR